MKTNYFLASVLILFISIANIDSASAQIFRWGVKGGIDVADHKVNSDLLKVSNRVGFTIGATMEASVPLTGFGVETGFQYGNKSYKVDNKEIDGDISNLSYLTVPIYLKKRFSLFGLAGIYISGGVYGNVKVSGGDLEIGDNKYKQKGFQTGAGVGAGVSLLNHLDLGINYRYKFTDTYSDDAAKDFYKVGRNTWNISLAYLF
ncbi:MAG: porin family protein [Dysgonomonas sp.]|nr:porin family protein [Dysgonomonas sp.]